jgi:hypothetical protein
MISLDIQLPDAGMTLQIAGNCDTNKLHYSALTLDEDGNPIGTISGFTADTPVKYEQLLKNTLFFLTLTDKTGEKSEPLTSFLFDDNDRLNYLLELEISISAGKFFDDFALQDMRNGTIVIVKAEN